MLQANSSATATRTIAARLPILRSASLIGRFRLADRLHGPFGGCALPLARARRPRPIQCGTSPASPQEYLLGSQRQGLRRRSPGLLSDNVSVPTRGGICPSGLIGNGILARRLPSPMDGVL